jgi:hypothetical protein
MNFQQAISATSLQKSHDFSFEILFYTFKFTTVLGDKAMFLLEEAVL